MREESLYFVKVKDVATREVRTCALSESAAQAAATMAEANVSGLVVCDLASPLGRGTDRDLRNKVVARGGDARELPVSAIMGQPLIFVDEDDFLIAALYKKSKHGVHRLPVLDESGRLRGILTTSDISW